MSESKIIDTIIKEAEQQAKAVVEEAEKKAQEKLSKKEELLKRETENKKSLAEKEAQVIIDGAVSSGEMSVRNEVLKAKRKEIEKAIDELFKDIQFDVRGYLGFVGNMIKNNIQDGDGLLLLNARDQRQFGMGLIRSFPNLSLADEEADIGGGFILKYDNIYIDCSLEALKAEKHDELVDFFNRELFK